MSGLFRALPICASVGLLLPPLAAAQQMPPQNGLQPPPVAGQFAPVPQPGAAQPVAAAPIAPAPPQGFQLNALEQAQLDAVLNSWQQESAKINTFRCPFERKEYDPAFGPADHIPLFVNRGELSFEKPDKGSFQITEIRKWQFTPLPSDQPPPLERKGDWVLDRDAVGEHWVCDGKNVFEYRHQQKQLVVRPIPPQMQGQAIVDGPLPFLFGADAAKLKKRYWLRINQAFQQQNKIMLWAIPKWPEDVANYKMVEIVLLQPKLLPEAMQIHLPNNGRNVYLFDLDKAKINNAFEQIKAWFKPPEILPGWQRVVEQLPVQQAAQPRMPPR
jgi:TIGR03009 family protein